jgi:uncharacterized protein YecE (DUF72 family)
MVKHWVGCSGFHYKHWKEIFYPKELPQRKWFDYYSEYFNTLELNVTFYKFPRLEYLESWYNRSPDNFAFSVKVPKAITHFKQFNDTHRMLGDFYGTTKEGLKDKLGCVLFQLPPRAKFTEERLAKILDNIDPSFSNVLEFRNETWWNAEVFDQLSANNISFCGMSHPLYPEDVVHNTSTVYYRFHGVPELYKSPYPISKLRRIAKEIKSTANTKATYLYFNNDIDCSAIQNAREMRRIMERK